jgi:SEC-C motif
MKTFRRNDPCPCGSGKKYKHCCLKKEETQAASDWLQAVPKAVSYDFMWSELGIDQRRESWATAME